MSRFILALIATFALFCCEPSHALACGSTSGAYASTPAMAVSFHPLQKLRANIKARQASRQAARKASAKSSSTCINGSCGCAGKCGGHCGCASCNCPANPSATPVAKAAEPKDVAAAKGPDE